MSIIGVDFDHTLREVDHKGIDRPFDGVKHAINLLREQGHKIFIHSCNNPEFIEQWMNNNDLRYDGIWTRRGKPICDLYVDDRGYHFKGDWKVAIDEILARLHD